VKKSNAFLAGTGVLTLGLTAAVGLGWAPLGSASEVQRVQAASIPGCSNPVDTWSVAQRVEQVIMVGGEFSDLAASEQMAAAGVGGFVLFGQPPAGSGPSIQAGIAQLDAAATANGELVPWMSTDEEDGPIARLADVLGALPSARQMAAQWTPAQVEAAMAAHGQAMRALGVTMDLAPVLDTASPSDPYAGESYRSFSEDGQVAAQYGLAYAQGLEQAGIVPVVKHFPGLGHAIGDTDTGPATDPPLSSLEQDDLIPFEQAIDAGLPVVMVGHPIVPGLSNGLPASMSPATYQFLRNNLHFGGVAMTDDLDAGAISAAGYTQPSAAVTAMEAGADMVMIDPSEWTATVAALTQAVDSGAISTAALDASVDRIASAKGVEICATVAMAPSPQGGYWLASDSGSVNAFGPASFEGSVGGVALNRPVVGMAADQSGHGYWLAASDGGVFNFGDAPFEGSLGNIRLNRPIVGMAANPRGPGYWLVASDGGVFNFGGAPFLGSLGNVRLNRPIVGMAANPRGPGYWLVASDGGIFEFGGAPFLGSLGNIRLNQPVVGMAADPDGTGYWLVASDGGIFEFGDAGFYGSTGNVRLNQPVVGMAAGPGGKGYWLVASDGGIFEFGDAPFYGSGA
jgi:beta-glucosidase-like glycosyl hydrolase